jgi:hypothetical protein
MDRHVDYDNSFLLNEAASTINGAFNINPTINQTKSPLFFFRPKERWLKHFYGGLLAPTAFHCQAKIEPI